MSAQGQDKRVVVVGASMAGLRTAEQLRAAGWDGDVLVIGDETHPPYNRPPLSKEVLSLSGTLDEALESVRLRQRSSASTVEFRFGEQVVASDLSRKSLTCASGESVSYDGLVIATGLRARRLKAPGPTANRYVVRSLNDALTLRPRLSPEARVLVIGCGFIGCEVAATASSLGCQVQLVEGSKGPMHRSVGGAVSTAMRDWLVARGVKMRTDSVIEQFLAKEDHDGQDRAAGVRLHDGTQIEADVIVEAIGSTPNTEWLEGNGLDLEDGVLVDDRLRVLGAEAAVAAGDVARYPDPWAGDELRRVEHWQGALDTAKTAARALVAELTGDEQPNPYQGVPSFWSDLFGTRIQGLGAPHYGTGSTVLEGRLEAVGEGLAVAYERDDKLVGVVTVGLPPARMLQFRDQLGRPVSEVLATSLSPS